MLGIVQSLDMREKTWGAYEFPGICESKFDAQYILTVIAEIFYHQPDHPFVRRAARNYVMVLLTDSMRAVCHVWLHQWFLFWLIIASQSTNFAQSPKFSLFCSLINSSILWFHFSSVVCLSCFSVDLHGHTFNLPSICIFHGPQVHTKRTCT